jgi:fatty acid elongase 3
MYWYYFQSARGIRVRWKEWITRLQIIQFVLDLGMAISIITFPGRCTNISPGFVYFASWDYFTSTYAPHLPHMGTCAGEPYAAVAGDVILSSYLVLFISFYIATYRKAGKEAESAASGKRKKDPLFEKAEVTAVKGATRKSKRGSGSSNKARNRTRSSR